MYTSIRHWEAAGRTGKPSSWCRPIQAGIYHYLCPPDLCNGGPEFPQNLILLSNEYRYNATRPVYWASSSLPEAGKLRKYTVLSKPLPAACEGGRLPTASMCVPTMVKTKEEISRSGQRLWPAKSVISKTTQRTEWRTSVRKQRSARAFYDRPAGQTLHAQRRWREIQLSIFDVFNAKINSISFIAAACSEVKSIETMAKHHWLNSMTTLTQLSGEDKTGMAAPRIREYRDVSGRWKTTHEESVLISEELFTI